MNEQSTDDDLDDEDEEFHDYEDFIDDFIAHRLAEMGQVGNQYPTRDGFMAQVMLLVELALLGIPQSQESAIEVSEMYKKFNGDGIAITERPTNEWSEMVTDLAVDYIAHRREVDHLEHKAHCPNCNPPENRNN